LNCLQTIGTAGKRPILDQRKDLVQDKGIGRVGLSDGFLVRGEDLGEADGITAKIVHEHIIDVALLADVTLEVFSAAEDVNEALALEEMVVVPAFETRPSVRVSLEAFADVQTVNRREKCKKDQGMDELGHDLFEFEVRNLKEYNPKRH
jgi:hypothetical protein